MRLDGVKKGCYCAFSFGPFVRLILSSGAPSQTHSQRPPNRACPKNGQAPALNFFSQKPSELPPPAAKRAIKKSPEQFAMNCSGLFFFTQGLLSTLLGKGQNWDQNWDGFGWGKLKICQRSTNNTRIGPAILTTFLPRQHSRHALISSPPGQNSQFSSFTLLLLKNCTYLLKKADISSRPAPIL